MQKKQISIKIYIVNIFKKIYLNMWNYVALENKFDEIKRKNFFSYWFISSFVWMCFHFTLVFFFLIQLKSPLLVWIFLWLWNFVSFLADSPVWVFQKYFEPKKIFLFWAYLMLFVALIFLYFIYQTNTLDLQNISLDFSVEALKSLLWSFLNIALLLIAVWLYWIIKEISDVTSLSYIMNNSDPSEYSSLFSKRNIYCWIWSLVWLVSSWIILAFNTLIAVSILVILIILFIIFIMKYFDNWTDEFNFWDIRKIKLITKEEILNTISKENILNRINQYKTTILNNKGEYLEKTKNLKVIFLKPIELKNSINFKEVYQTTIEDLRSFFDILMSPPYNYRLLIMWFIFTLFWFWDTFVTSFLIDFIDEVLSKNASDLSAIKMQNIFTAYVFIALLAIPAYWAQIPLIKLADKIWILKILLIWVLISWISIFFFWIFDSLIVVLWLWLLNSVWYAASMPLSQWEFSTEYNNTYAQKKNLKQIDANASSAPIKMLSNLANVWWLILWWILIQIFWYIWTFFVFGWILIWVFVISILKQKEYKL